ncbi:MAG: tetratricopeptide repeat protein [Clostridia bacterium]|nr:tetratricopeptide repeat protein [Clostridia bacterium]
MIWRIYLQKARNANAKGDTDLAISYMYQMLKYRPNAKAKILLGYFLLKKNRIEQAEEIFEKHIMTDKQVLKPAKKRKKDGKIKLNKLEMSAKTNYALLLWKKGDIQKAIELLEYVHAHMRTTDLYCNLGYLYILSGDMEKALKYNLKAYDFNPNHNGICDNLAYTYYKRGEYDDALELYEEIMEHEKKPGFPECYYNYGVVLAHFGEKEKAAKQFEHALQLEFDGFCNITKEQVEDALKNLS